MFKLLNFILIFFLFTSNLYSIETSIACSLEGIEDKKEIKIVKKERKVYIRKLGITDRWQQNQDYLIKDLGIVWISPLPEDGMVELQSLTTSLKSHYSNVYDFKIDKNHFESWLLVNNIPYSKAQKDNEVIFNYIFEHVKDKKPIYSYSWECESL